MVRGGCGNVKAGSWGRSPFLREQKRAEHLSWIFRHCGASAGISFRSTGEPSQAGKASGEGGPPAAVRYKSSFLSWQGAVSSEEIIGRAESPYGQVACWPALGQKKRALTGSSSPQRPLQYHPFHCSFSWIPDKAAVPPVPHYINQPVGSRAQSGAPQIAWTALGI